MTTGIVLFVIYNDEIVRGGVRVTESDNKLHDYTCEVDFLTWDALSTDEEKLDMLVEAWNIVRDEALLIDSGFTKTSTWTGDPVTLT